MLGFYGGKGLSESFFLKLSAHQCAILDQVVLSDVARGSSTESARATLLRRGDADFGVSSADQIVSAERFSSTAVSAADSREESHDTRLNLGEHRG